MPCSFNLITWILIKISKAYQLFSVANMGCFLGGRKVLISLRLSKTPLDMLIY